MTDDQIVVTIEAKRRLFFCEDQKLQDDIERAIPCEAEVTFIDNTLTDFKKM